MKLRLFGPGGRVWRLAFRIKHTAKSLKYRQLYNIEGGGGGENLILDCPSYRTAKLSTEVRIIESSSVIIPD